MDKKSLPSVAYFSMEYGLESSFKTYAGGLGILAGDYLKGAKDYGFPVVGVGIRWKQGYTDQRVDSCGKPYDEYHNYEYDFLEDTGVKVSVSIRNRNVLCKVWKVDCFGNAPLYLLDTDLPENEDRWITGQLYGWFGEERIAQEMVLGIAGVRALRALGIKIDVYHFNEGHAVFAGFELIREKTANGMKYDDALREIRKEIVFTTHTPIIEGNESHYIDRLMYMGANNGLIRDNLIKIGGDPFNMTVAGLRLSKISNAVSEIHRQTANKMWKSIEGRSEIIGITNAIHIPTWVDNDMISAADNGDLWQAHMKNKCSLIEFVKERSGVKLRPDCLTIGFSRRAARYKRSNLIFSDKNSIEPLLKGKKMQIVFSGKSHPLDDTGKRIIEDIINMSREYCDSVVFIENYDMTIGGMLTKGCDIWLNNPIRPKEASGTSGMKAAINGVLNLSILDGWWPEACKHGINGWQFGDGYECDNEHELEVHDAKALYKVLNNEVIPTYYNNHQKWVEMMRNSILSTKDMFSVKRMLEEYFEKMYMVHYL